MLEAGLEQAKLTDDEIEISTLGVSGGGRGRKERSGVGTELERRLIHTGVRTCRNSANGALKI